MVVAVVVGLVVLVWTWSESSNTQGRIRTPLHGVGVSIHEHSLRECQMFFSSAYFVALERYHRDEIGRLLLAPGPC
jgi:hypothetical protein